MTYPQAYQQFPPSPLHQPAPPVQHIDPRYVQQYAPQYPMPPQGYPSPIPAQQQPAGPVGGQMPPTAAPALGESTRTGGGPKAPAPRHLVGRTVIFEPIRIDETTRQKNDKTGEMELRPTAYYNLTIVDGGPLQYGDNQGRKPGEAHGMTMETQVPARFTNVSSDRFGIVNEVRDCMARGDMVSVGVIQQGTRGNYPFLVTKCAKDLDGNERPDGAQRFEAATAVWNAIFAKTFQSPEPRSLVAPPPVQPQQVAYQPTAPAGYAQQQYAQTGTVPTPYGAAPAGQLHPEYVAAATRPAYNPQGYQQPLQQYTIQPQQPADQYASGFQTPYAAANPGTGPYGDGPAPQQSAPPAAAPNPAYEAWLATLPPEQAAAMRAQAPSGPGF